LRNELPVYVIFVFCLQAAPLEEPTNAICQRLAKECIYDQQQLEESKARCANLEKDCDVLRDENLSLQQELSESKLEADSLVAEKQAQLDDLRMRCVALERDLSSSRQEAHRLATEKQELAGQLGTERQKMDELKQDIRVICGDLLQREGQLTSIYTKSKAIIESCKASQVATLL
jgi:centromeric protein E